MLIKRNEACLIISCMQKEFLPTLIQAQKLIDDCFWLIDFACQMDIPVIIANHKKLGDPIKEFLSFSESIISTEMTTFSCLEDEITRKAIESTGRTQFLLAGAETHISILQSAQSFQERNIKSYVIADASSARSEIDHDVALKRMTLWGVPVLTKEMVFFECLGQSTYPNYMDLSLKFLDQRYLRH
tara:strand:- start:2355 stop:2912 length:558 start_codon:yes stop_codon:yes gene_type:complete